VRDGQYGKVVLFAEESGCPYLVVKMKRGLGAVEDLFEG